MKHAGKADTIIKFGAAHDDSPMKKTRPAPIIPPTRVPTKPAKAAIENTKYLL